MLSRVFTKVVVGVMLSAIAGTSATFGQIWMEESAKFPVYNNLIRQYKALKPSIDRQKMTAAERDASLSKLRELSLVAEQLKKNAQSDPNGSEELKVRYDQFTAALNSDIARVERLQPSEEPGPLPSGASMRLTANTTIFAPADDVEFRFVLPEGLQGKVWVGLMKSSEPHRDLPYLDPSININPYQPKSLESRANGVFEYSAPQNGGMYDVRMFDKESGREITTAQFRVEANFIAELEAWRKELDAAVATNLAPRYGDKTIKGTYAAAFAAGGSTDPKYVADWSMWFWLHNVNNSPGNAGYVFYHQPIEKLYESYRNIKYYKQAYSNEDVQHYREGMRRWRATHMKIYPLFEQAIRIDAERNRDLLETYERLKSLHGAEREAEEKAAAKRSDVRKDKMARVVSQLNELKAQPIFTRAAGQKKPA